LEPVFVVFIEEIPLCCGSQFPAEFKEKKSYNVPHSTKYNMQIIEEL
jgi:hypothetical protein